MKKTRFASLATCAALCGALGLGFALTPSALAQPGAAPTTKKGKNQGKNKKTREPRISKRMVTAIEAKTGKPLTDQQKTQLNEAQKTRQTAVEAAHDRYLSDIATVTGLSVADVTEIEKSSKKGGGATPNTANMGAAPATAR